MGLSAGATGEAIVSNNPGRMWGRILDRRWQRVLPNEYAASDDARSRAKSDEMEAGDIAVRFEDAAYAYCIGNYAGAAVAFEQLVRLRHAGAAAYLAEMVLRGEGVERDVQRGIALLELATEWGDSTAAFNLGALYRSGADDVPVRPELSRKYFVIAKELGCTIPIDPYCQ